MDKFYTASTAMIVCSVLSMLISARYNIGLGKTEKFLYTVMEDVWGIWKIVLV